ncbi:MAG TPA: MAPEG family protein [Caulobacteraceae bacterium]|jgi:hypothetical protein
MTSYIGVALVTIGAMIVYFTMAGRVGRARTKYGVEAPATTGHADFERVFRVQANTLEGLPPFLTGLWLFGLYLNEPIATALGVAHSLHDRLFARRRGAQPWIHYPAARHVGAAGGGPGQARAAGLQVRCLINRKTTATKRR